MIARLGLAAAAFAATDVDDLLLLAAFFSSPAYRRGSVVAGQFLGIGVLLVASIFAALVAIVLPERAVALLGIFPLLLGLRRLVELVREKRHGDPLSPGVSSAQPAPSRWQILGVAAVTIANGGDNVAVYVPLFAADMPGIPIYAAVFALMTAVWCLVGYWLVNSPWLGAPLRRYGRVLLPFVLIGLGLYVLATGWL